MICHEPALYPAVCSHSAPAAILAGALLKDNETGEILAQLKLKNVQANPIKALTISLQALDTAGQKLGSPVPYHYLDLSIPQDGEFGQKDAIVLPHVAARGFQPKVPQVIFSDGTLWETGGEAWESIPPQVTLEKALGDEALCKEYRARFPGASYLPQKDGPSGAAPAAPGTGKATSTVTAAEHPPRPCFLPIRGKCEPAFNSGKSKSSVPSGKPGLFPSLWVF